jgi:hypothetical protein
VTVDPGRWEGPAEDGLGLLVLRGALLRIVTFDGQPRAEMLGAGDVLRVSEGTSHAQTTWQAVVSTELAALDGRVRDAVCAWPSVVRALPARSKAPAIALPLTHDMVAMLVGAHRPTVTSALHRLAGAGMLCRRGEGGWLLAAVESSPLEAIVA